MLALASHQYRAAVLYALDASFLAATGRAVGSAVEFEFDPGVTLTGTTDYFVFAVATCDADRANIDPASGQHCATLGAPVIDLVANDNNLGLRVLTI